MTPRLVNIQLMQKYTSTILFIILVVREVYWRAQDHRETSELFIEKNHCELSSKDVADFQMAGSNVTITQR